MGDGEWPRRILDTHKRTTTTTTCLIFASGISRLNKCDRSFSRLVSDSRYLIESPRTTPDCLPLCRFFFAFYIRSLLESIEKGSFRSALELWSKYFRLGLIDREPSFLPRFISRRIGWKNSVNRDGEFSILGQWGSLYIGITEAGDGDVDMWWCDGRVTLKLNNIYI